MKGKTIVSILVALILVLVLLSDFHYKYLLNYDLDGHKFTLIVKLVIGIFLVSCILMPCRFKIKRINLYIIFVLGVCCFVGLASTKGQANLHEAIYMTVQYFFGIGVMMFFWNASEQIDTKYLLTTVHYVLWINLICVLLGYFYDISIFKTYHGTRFGFNGFFKSTSTATYFYMFSLIFFASIQYKTKWTYIVIGNIIIASLLVGSKSLYVFIAFYGLLILGNKLYNTQQYLSRKWFSVIFAGLIMVFGILLFKPLISVNNILKKVLNDDGVISAFFSYRDLHVKNAIVNIQEHYSFINYIFGGLGYIDRPTEIALIDLFLTFGAIGMAVFIFFLIKNFPKIDYQNTKILIFGVIAIIVLRGNFFYFPSEIFISITIFALALNRVNMKQKN